MGPHTVVGIWRRWLRCCHGHNNLPGPGTLPQVRSNHGAFRQVLVCQHAERQVAHTAAALCAVGYQQALLWHVAQYQGLADSRGASAKHEEFHMQGGGLFRQLSAPVVGQKPGTTSEGHRSVRAPVAAAAAANARVCWSVRTAAAAAESRVCWSVRAPDARVCWSVGAAAAAESRVCWSVRAAAAAGTARVCWSVGAATAAAARVCWLVRVAVAARACWLVRAAAASFL
jgi:hypothetical protein